MSQENIKYDGDSIQSLKGLEPVRKRPGMYIGSTDSTGLHHLVWEIVDNAIDEALQGFGKEIIVTIHEDNSIEVQDFGRGIPLKRNEQGNLSTEMVFTVLHSGGKFGGGGYKVSGGLHGVGIKVVNALSSTLTTTICRDGKIYRQKFIYGDQTICPLEILGDTKKTGTVIHFKPDAKIFSTTLFNYEVIREKLRESAFLIKNLKIVLHDKRGEKTSEEFVYSDGIKEYLSFLMKEKEPIGEIAYFEGVYENIEVEIALCYFKNNYSEIIKSFANNVRTKDGGSHETGFKTALTKCINEYARKYNLLKDKDPNLDGTDIREGSTAIISVRIPENIIEFEGQTKTKLGTPLAKTAVESIFFEKLTYFLEENKAISEEIIKKAIESYTIRLTLRKNREQLRNGKEKNKRETNLTGKLSPAQSKDKERNELFLVEGDSAGGSAKQGRDRRFQAILPLRGKVINTEKNNYEDILANEEIQTIIHTIGADVGHDFDIKKCNYKKIIIMTDADTDGAHIQVLLLTFFFRYMRQLIEYGQVYIAMPPLYKITRKGKKDTIHYAWTDQERQTLTSKEGNFVIQRYKGLGEMNAEQLWETTMDPKTRTLVKVNIDDLSDAEKLIETLMGKKADIRKEWIDNHVSFDKTDNFMIKGGDEIGD